MQDITNTALKSGAAVVLSTVGVNTKDCPPFVSLHKPAWSSENEKTWQTAINDGESNMAAGNYAAAETAYAAAIAMDDEYAETFYHLGKALLAQKKLDAAREALVRALDLDILRLRADTQINQTIRNTANIFASQGVILVDCDKELNAADPEKNAGNDFFYEHVHMTPEGNYRIAQMLYDAIVPRLAPRLGVSSAPLPPSPSRETCWERLCLTPIEEQEHLSNILQLIMRPPFTNQYKHETDLMRFRQDMLSLNAFTNQNHILQYKQQMQNVLQAHPDDHIIRSKYASLLTRVGNLEESLTQFQIVAQTVHSRRSYIDWGMAMAATGQFQGALEKLLTASRIDAPNASLLTSLGWVKFRLGRLDDAILDYRKAIKKWPSYVMAHYNLAIALSSNGCTEEAIQECTKAIEANPPFAPVYAQLDDLFSGRITPLERAHKWNRMAKEMSTNPFIAYREGLAWLEAGDLQKAVLTFQEVIHRDPCFLQAHLEIALILEKQNDLVGAIAEYNAMLAYDNTHYYANNNRGYCLFLQKKFDEAIQSLKKAIEFDPFNKIAFENLSSVLNEKNDAQLSLDTWAEIINAVHESPIAYFHYGQCLEKNQRISDAQQAYRKALQLDPGYQNAQQAMSILSTLPLVKSE
ncbi:MAG TPA: tetratricopeptide repeat protein [Candidatus Hydrogenedentes bacterium]|nr:tetratricopeptide repeat protein [Candidatus Hydrogenedentota bacterium]